MDAKGQQILSALQYSTLHGIMDFDDLYDGMNELAKIYEEPNLREDKELTRKTGIHARVMLSELFDYTGQYERAAKIIKPYMSYETGPELLRHIKNRNTKLYGRISTHIGRVHYHKRSFSDSVNSIKQGLEIHIQNGDKFGEGMAAMYLAATLHRQRNFTEAREQIYSSIAAFSCCPNGGRKYRVAICQTILAWVAFRLGSLDEARASLYQAQLTLSETDDVVHQGSINSILGSIERSKASTGGDFKSSEEYLLKALDLYQRAKHNPLITRSLNNIGHMYCRMGRFDEAEKALNKSLKLIGDEGKVETKEDIRTRIEAIYFLSRVYYGKEEWCEAAKKAKKAQCLASKHEIDSIECESIISLSRIYLASGKNLRTIHKRIETVHEKNRHKDGSYISPKTEAASHLVMSQWCYRIGALDISTAKLHYDKAVEIISKLQNNFLETWANEVKKEIGKLTRDFRIDFSCQNLNYFSYQEKLRFWLLSNAISRSREHGEGKINRAQSC